SDIVPAQSIFYFPPLDSSDSLFPLFNFLTFYACELSICNEPLCGLCTWVHFYHCRVTRLFYKTC
ncbi:hypothetical protein, partial [Enterobacter hormaechei]|uniref:hypothetical protein n=1 Tax=Enterobacter hormaechei TaxID=158836 RepID=UPI001D00DA7E